jgi:hypothetical protein
MTQTDLQELGSLIPYPLRKFNLLTRYRFLKACRKMYLDRVLGEPTDKQIRLARTAAMLTYAHLQAVAIETADPLRGADHASRHVQRLVKVADEFERTLPPPRIVIAPPAKSLAEHLAAKAAP